MRRTGESGRAGNQTFIADHGGTRMSTVLTPSGQHSSPGGIALLTSEH